MAHCKICGVETQNGNYCKSCEADKQRIDAHKEADHKDTVKFLIGLPSHLFFYGLKYLLLDKDRTGKTLNEFLLYTVLPLLLQRKKMAKNTSLMNRLASGD